MIDQSINNKISIYKDNFTRLYSALKWKCDKRMLMLISAMYATTSRELGMQRFLDISEHIKNEVGLFSHLKSAHRYPTAATLDTTTVDPKNGLNHLLKIYDKLIENGLGRNVFSYITAGTLLKIKPDQIDYFVMKTTEIYKGIKNNHYFLTTASDYPLVAILAFNKNSSEGIAKEVEEYYQSLNELGFSKGNDLQFLSQILILNSEQTSLEKAEQCLKIKTLFEKYNFKVKKLYYPYLGMLTFLEKPEDKIETLIATYKELNNEKHLKWYKDINFMMSVLFLIHNESLLGDAAKTGINTTIEIILQAQQAAMTASISAAIVADSSGD